MNVTRVVAAVALILVGAGSIAAAPNTMTHRSIPSTVVAPRGLLPTVVHHSDAQTVEAYEAALRSPEVLRSVPCTCGCIASLGHENNFDCYVDAIQKDTVTYSTHGLYCYVCQAITRDTVAGAASGMNGDELRQMILDRYDNGS